MSRQAPAIKKTQVDAICKALTNGCPYRVAFRLADVSERTAFLWLSKAREMRDKGTEPKTAMERTRVQFLHRLEKAEAMAIQRNIGVIQLAAPSSWQAGAWWLERRYL